MGMILLISRKDAANKPVTALLMWIIAALRILAYGKFFAEVNKLCDMSAASTRESFLSFITVFIAALDRDYPHDEGQEVATFHWQRDWLTL